MTLGATEAELQRRATEWFVGADAFDCALSRAVKTPDGSGGHTTTRQPQPVQRLRLIPLSEPGATERQTSDGRVVNPSYVLLGNYGADIKRFDTFSKDGRRYEVVFVVENQQYQVKAEVTYVG